MEDLFYNLRVRKICNKNPEAIKEKNDKFDYKKKKFYMAKPNMNTDNKLGKKMFVICLLISQRKGQFPRITELL